MEAKLEFEAKLRASQKSSSSLLSPVMLLSALLNLKCFAPCPDLQEGRARDASFTHLDCYIPNELALTCSRLEFRWSLKLTLD